MLSWICDTSLIFIFRRDLQKCFNNLGTLVLGLAFLNYLGDYGKVHPYCTAELHLQSISPVCCLTKNLINTEFKITYNTEISDVKLSLISVENPAGGEFIQRNESSFSPTIFIASVKWGKEDWRDLTKAHGVFAGSKFPWQPPLTRLLLKQSCCLKMSSPSWRLTQGRSDNSHSIVPFNDYEPLYFFV